MKDITKKMYNDMLLSLKPPRYAKKTIMSIHETGSLLFGKAVELEIISTNVARNAEMPFSQETVTELEEKVDIPKYLEKEQLAQFLRTAAESKDFVIYALFNTMAYTGMRIGEACALKWKDIDFEAQTISITKTIYNKNNKQTHYAIHTPKTRKSRRTIDVESEVLNLLEQQRAKQNELRMKYRNIYHDEGFVFTIEKETPGYPLVPNRTNRQMKTIVNHAGLKQHFTTHSLRHTHTSLLAEAGVSLEQIMDRLGHEDDAITKRIYLHVTKPRKKEASQKFAELMRSV